MWSIFSPIVADTIEVVGGGETWNLAHLIPENQTFIHFNRPLRRKEPRPGD